MATLIPELGRAQRLVVKIGSALLVDGKGLRTEWLRALWSRIAPSRAITREEDSGSWQP